MRGELIQGALSFGILFEILSYPFELSECVELVTLSVYLVDV